MFQEYPKSLYLHGDSESAHVIVQNAQEEAEQRKQGFCMYGEQQKENKRPRKAKA